MDKVSIWTLKIVIFVVDNFGSFLSIADSHKNQLIIGH